MIANWAIQILPAENFTIANYGGGNGIVSKKITDEAEKLITNAGFKIIKEEKLFYSISIADFYKNRFNLSLEEVNKIAEAAGAKDHKESQIFILAQKN